MKAAGLNFHLFNKQCQAVGPRPGIRLDSGAAELGIKEAPWRLWLGTPSVELDRPRFDSWLYGVLPSCVTPGKLFNLSEL